MRATQNPFFIPKNTPFDTRKRAGQCGEMMDRSAQFRGMLTNGKFMLARTI
jgi:hypothetical protein